MVFRPSRRWMPALLVAPVVISACERKPCDPDALETSSSKKGPVVRLDVALATCNARPTAVAKGPGGSAKYKPVVVDGSESSDPNGDELSFAWRTLESPRKIDVTFVDPAAPKATFTPTASGTYVFELVVSDGELESEPVEVTVVVINNPPVAVAGEDFPSPLGTQAILDGSMSTDADGDTLTYLWTLTQRPANSTSILEDGATVQGRLTPDVYGVYYLSLVVNDGEVDSEEDVVRVGGGVTGVPPIANAGPDIAGVIGLVATLDGSASYDPEGSGLTYEWRVLQEPLRSAARGTFADPLVAQPRFLPAKEGSYVVELVVSDGFYFSQPDTMLVNTVPGIGMIGGPCEPDGCPQFSICLDAICVPRGGCGAKTEAGSDQPETHTIELGLPSGTFEFYYDTYSIEDRVVVLYENRPIFDSGCVGRMETKMLTYSGAETSVTVQIMPNCTGGTGTAWEFTVGCPL